MTKLALTPVLIAYYSWHGNTRKIAGIIQRLTGGDMFEIVPTQPYSSDYSEVVARGKKERMSGIKPALSALPKIQEYPIIILGSPIWWGTMALPVTSFLDQLKLKDKNVIPFYTHGGGGGGSFEWDIKTLTPGATVSKGFGSYNDSGDEVVAEITEWLKSIKLIV